jgi:hypothetical protein
VGTNVYAGFNATGAVFLGYSTNLSATDLIAVDTPLDGRTADIHMQFNVAGNLMRLWAWEDGRDKPVNPQVTALVPAGLSPHGRLNLGVIQSATNPEQIRVAFREFAAVPEPSAIALGSLSGLVLANIAFRMRLRRG